MLDERLSLAAALYHPCDWGADIGTDHAYLPCHLLRAGICQHMIVADVSEKALARAKENLTRQKLINRAEVVLADGLDAITRKCGCISVMGMGGELMGNILRKNSSIEDKTNRLIAIESEKQNAEICDYVVEFDTYDQAVQQLCEILQIEG